MESIILDLSGAAFEEGLPQAVAEAGYIDLTVLEGTNCFCSDSAAAELRSVIAGLPVHALHWTDTGDYHYLTKFWLERAASELGNSSFALVLFDHHPDMQESSFGSLTSCGGWAREAFTGIEGLTQVLAIGINPDLELEMLDLVFEGVLAVTSEDLRHTGDALGQDVLEMISLLEPGIPVYISIDKDVLTRDFARTNWDHGNMTLAQLESAVRAVAKGHRIIGADVCGGITRSKGASDEDLSLNLETDLALRNLFANIIID